MSDVISRLPRAKRWLLALSTFAVGILIALLAAEVFLRVVPIRGIQLNPVVYDETAGSGLHPGSVLTYRSENGHLIRRHINKAGYPDRDHARNHPGFYRIGFFGDSYTEARQVPLADTFFRVIEKKLSNAHVETLAFGLTGFSMFQSYLTYARWVEHYDLDMVVYVFVENDLGDQLRVVRRDSKRPYPVLMEKGIVSDNSFQKLYEQRSNVFRSLGDRLTARSLVFATLAERLRLLQRHGIKMRVTEEDRAMATKAVEHSGDSEPKLPNQNDNPSTWPAPLRDQAIMTGEAVLGAWADDAAARTVEFAVAYMPREREMEKTSSAQDSWKLWLKTFCDARGISMIDPTNELVAMRYSGKPVFSDHLTPDGHAAFAQAFVEWFLAAHLSRQ